MRFIVRSIKLEFNNFPTHQNENVQQIYSIVINSNLNHEIPKRWRRLIRRIFTFNPTNQMIFLHCLRIDFNDIFYSAVCMRWQNISDDYVLEKVWILHGAHGTKLRHTFNTHECYVGSFFQGFCQFHIQLSWQTSMAYKNYESVKLRIISVVSLSHPTYSTSTLRWVVNFAPQHFRSARAFFFVVSLALKAIHSHYHNSYAY